MEQLREIEPVYRALAEAGATRILVVGGFMRDYMFGMPSHDIDTEVYGLPPAELERVLSRFGETSLVGASFGIYLLRYGGREYEFAIPRKERKIGAGHTAFEAQVDPFMDVTEALSRRDYTMNAMAYDWIGGQTFDPFGGKAAIFCRKLQHVGPAFAEDPLRVLRGMQFCGRFGLDAIDDTLDMAYSLITEYSSLSKERVWGEWWKWATKSVWPSMGLRFLYRTNWVYLYSCLAALDGCPQNPAYHPEGDVWQHTKITCDCAADIARLDRLSTEDTGVLVLAALLHDTGKPTATVYGDGKITSAGHAKYSAELAEMFLESIGAPKGIIAKVVALVREHMAEVPNANAIRRLAVRLEPTSIPMLARLMEADGKGSAKALIERAEALECQEARPKAILMGRHLMDVMRPGPAMGRVLRQAYEAQLEGAFFTVEDAKAWALGQISL